MHQQPVQTQFTQVTKNAFQVYSEGAQYYSGNGVQAPGVGGTSGYALGKEGPIDRLLQSQFWRNIEQKKGQVFVNAD